MLPHRRFPNFISFLTASGIFGSDNMQYVLFKSTFTRQLNIRKCFGIWHRNAFKWNNYDKIIPYLVIISLLEYCKHDCDDYWPKIAWNYESSLGAYHKLYNKNTCICNWYLINVNKRLLRLIVFYCGTEKKG